MHYLKSPKKRLIVTATENGGATIENNIIAFNEWFREQASVDSSKIAGTAAFLGNEEGVGMIATRNIKAGENVMVAPTELIFSYEAALASPEVGAYLEGLKAWQAVVILLLSERSKEGASKWGPYIKLLPQHLPLPMFWEDAELAELEGTQVLQSSLEYREYVEAEFLSLKEFLFDLHPDVFPPKVFSAEGLLWGFGLLRSRSFDPLAGASAALVPGLDLLNLALGGAGTGQAQWVQDRGVLAGVLSRAGKGVLTLKAVEAIKEGDQICMSYGEKSNSELALDFGIVDQTRSEGAYLLSLSIPEGDTNFDDKVDVAEVSGLGESWQFALVGGVEPQPEFLTFLRLVQLQGEDTFLLEALFRDSAWERISLPVSQQNEEAVCVCMIEGCGAALDQYPTSESTDLGLLAQPDLPARQRVAVSARLSEKRALLSTMLFFEQLKEKLPFMEYYQERRLKQLGLLDDNGISTFEDFMKDGIA
eukprot:CAMPEP_0196582864 /NCGR_PEP_ID=MMETSP1081-20130531/41028_1 /TAXON_ID=36882 /ORGANISM="Pyramimonas amylifera, Strain CCMP720" /LENGTH=476 /DNA_ID=CAMNT_0041903577 /DNA_START=158 /DNA_END=1588 /DNA_ORIENTATION=-